MYLALFIIYFVGAIGLSAAFYVDDCDNYGEAYAGLKSIDSIKHGFSWPITLPFAIAIFLVAACKAR